MKRLMLFALLIMLVLSACGGGVPEGPGNGELVTVYKSPT